MAFKKQLEEELVDLSTMQTLVQSYEEIASYRMKRTRDSVLRNREFIAAINEIFEKVRSSYGDELRSLLKSRGREGAITFLAHNGKKVAVLLSANTGLYGSIVKRTFEMFMEEVEKGESEVTIVGKYGLLLFREAAQNTPYTFFDLSDHSVNSGELDPIVRHVVQYNEVHLYFGEFVNVLRQIPKRQSVTSEIKVGGGKAREKVSYIFEPSVEEILKFFETQIFASIFDQVVREAQLSKFASRVSAMDRADENIREKILKLKFDRLRAVHELNNRKQLNSLTSALITRWK